MENYKFKIIFVSIMYIREFYDEDDYFNIFFKNIWYMNC